MTTPAGPQGPQTGDVDPVIASYINSYNPTTLSDEQWRRVRAEVVDLALRAEPVSTTDAKTFMSSLCAFLAWSELKNGELAVAAALSADHVRRHIGDLEGTMSDGGRSNARGRLQRAQRVLAGEAARTKRQPRDQATPPLTADELARLATAAGDSDALALLLPGLGIGSETREFEAFMPPSGPLWTQARRAADAVGVKLTLDRLRVSWAVRQLHVQRPLTVTLTATPLTRADLENAKDHLPAIDPGLYRASLRG